MVTEAGAILTGSYEVKSVALSPIAIELLRELMVRSQEGDIGNRCTMLLPTAVPHSRASDSVHLSRLQL